MTIGFCKQVGVFSYSFDLLRERVVVLLFFSLGLLSAQETTKDSVSLPKSDWKNDFKLGVLLTQTAFVNWNAGGDNTVSGIVSFRWRNTYKKEIFFVENILEARYGVNKREGQAFQKTDDIFRFESSIGYRKNAISKWYYSGRFSFNTQFYKGYKYPNREDYISTLFAPAYLMVGIGAEFKNLEKGFKVHISPITNKTTFVLDDKLSKIGAFGVSKGDKLRLELGLLTTIFYRVELMKNVQAVNRITLYSDYIKNPGKVDVSLDTRIKMMINKYLEANLSLFLIFDDDIKDKKTKEAEIQIKEILGIGFTYRF